MAEPKSKALRPEQIDIFARGLNWIAGLDERHPEEIRVIEEFLLAHDSEWEYEDIKDSAFEPRDLPVVLGSSHLRRLFLNRAVRVVAADGSLSPSEETGLYVFARFLGLSDKAFANLKAEALEEVEDTRARPQRRTKRGTAKKAPKKKTRKKAAKKKARKKK